MSDYITSGKDASKAGYLVLLRHGQTAWSVTGQHTGRTDLPLTDVGRRQAAEGGERIRLVFPEGFDGEHVFSSPLRRASETARLAGFEDFVQLDDLMEWDYGRAEGFTRVQVSEALGRPWRLWVDGTEALEPGVDSDWTERLSTGEEVHVCNRRGETIDEVAVRARRVVDKVAPIILRGENVLLVAHAHILRIVASQWLGVDPHEARLLRLDTAHYSVLSYYKNDRVIEHWNM